MATKSEPETVNPWDADLALSVLPGRWFQTTDDVRAFFESGRASELFKALGCLAVVADDAEHAATMKRHAWRLLGDLDSLARLALSPESKRLRVSEFFEQPDEVLEAVAGFGLAIAANARSGGDEAPPRVLFELVQAVAAEMAAERDACRVRGASLWAEGPAQ